MGSDGHKQNEQMLKKCDCYSNANNTYTHTNGGMPATLNGMNQNTTTTSILVNRVFCSLIFKMKH